MQIARYINDLLYEHDCVIVPGLGGFVCSYRPAKIHPVQHQFYPPSKSILFNQDLQNNDGLLANKIAGDKKITYEQSLNHIQEFVEEVTAALNDGARVRLEQVGMLYRDDEGNLQFDQNHSVNHLKEAYGLAGMVSPPVMRQPRPTGRPQPVFIDRKPRPKTQKTKKKRWAWSIMPLALITGLLIFNINHIQERWISKMSLIPLYTENNEIKSVDQKNESNAEKNISFESRTPVKEMAHKPESMESPKPVRESAKSDPQPVNTEKPAESVSPPKIVQNTKTAVKQTPMYHIIGGSFKNTENAHKLISRYRTAGYDPSVIGPANGGFYRVSLMAFIRKNDALVELRKMRQMYNPDLWLLKQ